MQNGAKGKKAAPVSQKLSRRTHCMSATVFIVGLLSFAMLVWENKIHERQNMNSDHCDALMDIQISTASSHVQLEEGIFGDTSPDIEKVTGEIDLAISLAEGILNGGKSKHGQPLQPLKDSKLRKGAEDIHSLLNQFKAISLQRAQDLNVGRISSDIDEHFHAVFREIRDRAHALEIALERDKIRAQAKAKHLFWAILSAWIFIVVGTTAGLWSRETKRRHAEEALEKAKDQLEIEVTERTKELRDINDQLRHLSSQLLTAQENERKRIAAELHDELGASLALLRIEFTFIEQNLNEDQRELRNRCRHNLKYIEQLADDVSRLSRSLSPYLLEDLGLSASLRSLLSNSGKRLNIQVISEIPEMEHLFPQDVETTIYRIIQESLTNIGKHAQAKHVSMVIKIDDDQVHFTIQDDGKGINLEQAISKDAGERGMGLTTMNERARVIGGTLDIWSQERQGSRIDLHVPRKNRGTVS